MAAVPLVDYIMTVAVSVAAGVDNVISAVPELNASRIPINLGFVALLTAMNLRGVRESGKTFAVPTYLFIVGVLGMLGFGLLRTVASDAPVAEGAGYHIEAEQAGLAGLGLMLLALQGPGGSGSGFMPAMITATVTVPAAPKPIWVRNGTPATDSAASAITTVGRRTPPPSRRCPPPARPLRGSPAPDQLGELVRHLDAARRAAASLTQPAA